MLGKIRKMFPGANTVDGFYSFFDYIIPKDVNKIFCLKGGPGVGKSSFMKKIARYFVDLGYDIEMHHCSSDPSSIDGLVIKGLNVVLLDATSPHIVDPKFPGAVDEILNFGEFWRVEELELNRKKIELCSKEMRDLFQRAFKFLKSVEPIYLDVEQKNSNCMEWEKVNKLTDEFITNLFKNVKFDKNNPQVRHLFSSAITPAGYIDYSDSILKGVKDIYYLDGDIGCGKSTFLKNIYKTATRKGLDVEVYHYPLIVDKLQAVYIPKLNVAITTSYLFENREKVGLSECLNTSKLDEYNNDICEDKKIIDYMMKNAIGNLKRAKFKHDEMEEYYIPTMDFDKVEELKIEIIKRILDFKK